MLKDEPLEYIREQYEQKNRVLQAFGEQLRAVDMYEDIFCDTEMTIPVVIIDEEEDTKHIRTMTLDDAIVFGSCRNDVLIGGCTYFNNWISKRSAKNVYTLIIDYDNAYSGVLQKALQDDWKSANGEVFARPTYIVNSGTGLHLYFVFTEPIPNYRRSTEQIDKMYRALAIQQSRRVYVQRQIQWFGQDFRCAGGLNKYGWENTVFRIGEKWEPDKLAEAVGLKDVHFVLYGEPRTEKPKTRQKKREKGSGWHTNRAFYDYTLQTCHERTHEGNRYMSMCALSAIAYKCSVPRIELEKDLLGLLPDYNKDSDRPVKEKEVYSAMKMYNDRAMLTPRNSLENWIGWEYKPVKRNGQRQADHLEEARAIRDIRCKRRGEAWDAHNGRKPKRDIVLSWRKEHPKGRKAECIRDTGCDRKTVSKYWLEDYRHYS